MEKITGNEPAMPIIKTVGDGTGPIGSVIEPGLTIRQHFAAMAMQGLLYQNLPVDRALNESNENGNSQLSNLAQASVKCADALIEALNKY